MNPVSLPDPFIGKIILFRRPDHELILSLRSATGQECWIETQRGRKASLILASIRKLPDSKNFDDCFGFHREIPHLGEVLGGAIALYLEGVLYIDSESQAYGPLPRQLTADILSKPVVSSAGRALHQISISAVSEGPGISYNFGQCFI